MAALSDTTSSQQGDIDSLIAELDKADGQFPEGAIVALRGRRDEAVPKLIEAIRAATCSAREGNVPEGNAHFVALFLLTEFEAKEALPAIVESISLPGELPFDLYDDAVTEILARVLAALSDVPKQDLDPIIGNRAINEYVRWQAADAYVLLVRDGRLALDEAVETLRAHLRKAIADEDAEIAGPLVIILSSLAAKEALDEIRTAFDRDLVDPTFIDFKHVEESVAHGERQVRETLDACHPSGISDAIAELSTWYAFQETHTPAVPLEMWDTASRTLDGSIVDDQAWPRPQPFVSTAQRVGRNDPCPCGSGRKFKKCCGAPTSFSG